ncbi:hypothetical protein FE782_28290 [Paenibacillus antri]|uniref:Uncharacterized protein n=1 Tax=Paenibacillus antri TaxID=2582848 RepID=A0A5R9G7A6_9BACL|nr:hypothetical protein [Paenibacillus antri]TLS48904.1 hypothetical protein FE782_28290 [Paenibacillus antri]
MVGLEPELETNARAFILNAMFDHYSAAEWILTLTCLKEWFPLFELCGFERASWADTITVHGTEYRGFSLDLAQEDFLTKLDRLLTKHSVGGDSFQSEPLRDMNALKQLLKDLPNLPRNPAMAQLYGRLFPHRLTVDGSSESSGPTIQQDITHAIQRLSTGDDPEAVWGKLLHYVYIQGIRPHARVAERLNLSMATYYRHLNKALEQLYDFLAKPVDAR